jgi:uncharacterized membrane protein
MRTAILLLIVLVSAAQARADVAYSVFDVRPGDTLNMRLQPNPQAPVVFAIPHNATGIGLTGRTAQGGWVEVNFLRKRGWVNGRFLGFGQGRWGLPAYLDCSGTEPFWSIAVMPGLARAELLFAERRAFFNLTRAQSAMNRNDIWHLKASGRPGGDLSLIVRHEVCSDGMSDTRYPFSAVALMSGLDVIAGCCRRGTPR